ncbi:MAG: uL15 family ribosomal protein [Nanoarchaeota archaeon]|nr:uL15 family ribosomal protein [Nanoarchaeota archaeon]MBU1103746.1 uL15 family ribosomal protein [Nanoarchaeota archaeon]
MNKKRKKNTRHRGSHTAARGFKKKARGSGNRGGVGKAGTGKRADQKKNLIKYPFGKDKTLRKEPSKKLKTINLRDLVEKFKGKKEIELKGYKILGLGEVKEKLTIKASAASSSAIDKVKKAGGEILVSGK